MGNMYSVEDNKWEVIYGKKELIQKYGINLYNILETKWEYKSPEQPDNQLYILFDEDEN